MAAQGLHSFLDRLVEKSEFDFIYDILAFTEDGSD